MVWSIPFLIIGLYMLAGRYVSDAWQRARTWYGVSNERILIRTGPKLVSLSLASLAGMSVMEKPGGFGTLLFGETIVDLNSDEHRIRRPPNFELIRNAQQVLAIVHGAQMELSD